MAFPIKVCTVCSEEFELKPDKLGFANRCPECSEPEYVDSKTKQSVDAEERKSRMEANEARRQAMRDLLYRKDS
jgi:DNA-directed RNA polymerase subunit RPC12/RpoP